MKVEIHSLCWNNNDERIVKNHKMVFDHFNLPINYTFENIHHGIWMDRILNTSDADFIVFFDFDCVPFKKEYVEDAISLASNGYLVGNAQVTNCVAAKHDLFCAPSFLVINKKLYEDLGKPSCVNINNSDIAQEITRAAVAKEKRIKMYYPTSFQDVPVGGIWRLSGYGYYGIGTIHDDKFYHLYQGRLQKNINLFEDTCNKIINNKLDQIIKKYDSKKEWLGSLQIENDYGF